MGHGGASRAAHLDHQENEVDKARSEKGNRNQAFVSAQGVGQPPRPDQHERKPENQQSQSGAVNHISSMGHCRRALKPRQRIRPLHPPSPCGLRTVPLPRFTGEELGPEMLAELQPLALVVAAAFAVEAVGAFGQGLIDQTGDDLAVFKHEGGVVGADLEHTL